MKIAILGPVCKDSITVDETTNDQLGGIPYYTGTALSGLGADVTAYITYGAQDDKWVRDNFPGVAIRHIDAPGTLHFSRTYSSKNPDVCLSVKIDYFPNPIAPTTELLEELGRFDYIILSPLLHDNVSPEFFRALKQRTDKPIVHGNFGMFTYAINNEFVQKDPDQFMAAAPYVDHLFLDEKEVQFATSSASVGEAVHKLKALGVKEVVVTGGSRGSTLFTLNGEYAIPAYKPEVVADPTGAGDTYLAGYIAACQFYKEPLQRGKFAAMTATLSLEKRGAFSGSKEDVLKRLRENNEEGFG
jgi:sugar/nucleoside kinase (ribokinase family)